MADMGKLIGELIESGELLATDGLMPSSKGARVKQWTERSRLPMVLSPKPRS